MKMIAPSSVGSRLVVLLCALLSSSYLFDGALAQSNVACSVCDPGFFIGGPDNQVQDPIVGDRITCSELNERAAQGDYNVLQCRILQVYVTVGVGGGLSLMRFILLFLSSVLYCLYLTRVKYY